MTGSFKTTEEGGEGKIKRCEIKSIALDCGGVCLAGSPCSGTRRACAKWGKERVAALQGVTQVPRDAVGWQLLHYAGQFPWQPGLCCGHLWVALGGRSKAAAGKTKASP